MTSLDQGGFLPDHLAERVRILQPFPAERRGAYVLYWMHHAVRGHENPALDVAVWMGNRWGVPVLVRGPTNPQLVTRNRHSSSCSAKR